MGTLFKARNTSFIVTYSFQTQIYSNRKEIHKFGFETRIDPNKLFCFSLSTLYLERQRKNALTHIQLKVLVIFMYKS